MLLSRIRPYVDGEIRMPVGHALLMTGIEVTGLAVFLIVFAISGADESHVRSLLVPPLLTFVLVFVTAQAPASRPGRVMASYVIVGAISLGVATLPTPKFTNVLIACGLSMIVMHLLGMFHPPTLAVAILAPLTGFTVQEALVDYVALLGFALLALVMVFAAQRLFVDRSYPSAWY